MFWSRRKWILSCSLFALLLNRKDSDTRIIRGMCVSYVLQRDAKPEELESRHQVGEFLGRRCASVDSRLAEHTCQMPDYQMPKLEVTETGRLQSIQVSRAGSRKVWK